MGPGVLAVAESSTVTAGTNHVVTLPSGIVAGDLILICTNIGSTLASFNAHGSYTELLDEGVAGGLAIWYRQATGGEGNPTLVSTASTRDATITYRINGHIDPATQAPQVGTTATGTSTTPNPPTTTPTGGAKNYLAIAMFGRAGEEDDDDTWVTAAPAGYTGLLQKACTVAGTNLGGMVSTASRHFNAASEDPGTFTCATGAWRAQTIVVHPSAALPTGPYWEPAQPPIGRGY